MLGTYRGKQGRSFGSLCHYPGSPHGHLYQFRHFIPEPAVYLASTGHLFEYPRMPLVIGCFCTLALVFDEKPRCSGTLFCHRHGCRVCNTGLYGGPVPGRFLLAGRRIPRSHLVRVPTSVWHRLPPLLDSGFALCLHGVHEL